MFQAPLSITSSANGGDEHSGARAPFPHCEHLGRERGHQPQPPALGRNPGMFPLRQVKNTPAHLLLQATKLSSASSLQERKIKWDIWEQPEESMRSGAHELRWQQRSGRMPAEIRQIGAPPLPNPNCIRDLKLRGVLQKTIC